MIRGKNVWPLVLVLVIVQGLLHSQYILPRWSRDYSPKAGGLVAAQLSPDQILAQLFGFREFLAGILWVRADGFFDDGQYDAILPIIRLCTLLDPHEIDIYSVGMWHIAYNFTDQDQRSDRRYIPIALALGKEGVKNNPNTYELYFEMGWLWYHKIEDDPFQAVDWFKQAIAHKDMINARKDLLAYAYFENGDPESGLATYYTLYDEAVKVAQADPEFSNVQWRDTLEGNIDNTIVRMIQRGFLAAKRNDGSLKTGGYDTQPPFNVGFSVKATVLRPRIIKFEGSWNVLPVGTRIRVILRDLDYPNAKPAELDWDHNDSINFDPPRDLTYMQDSLFVKNQRFNSTIDMSRDPTMYPVASKRYLLEFFYNPRYAPPHIQDRFGYNGEGFTDAHFLNTAVRPGARVMYTTLTLTRDQILQRGEWTNRSAVVKTPNYVDSNNASSDSVIKIPSLRGGASGPEQAPAPPSTPQQVPTQIRAPGKQ